MKRNSYRAWTAGWVRPLLALAALAGSAAGDEIYLKGGGQVSGRILSRTGTTIEVEVGAGTIGLPVSSVVRIEERRSPLDEFDERAGKLAAGDVDGWVALGALADGQGLGSQSREAYHRALTASPADPRANAALGNVQLDGRWVSEEDSYRARGYVQFEGDWMPAAERAAIERERAADDARAREQEQADARAREAEAQADEAEARAREASMEQTSDGIPIGYVWGAGPGYWPTRPIQRPPANPVRPVVRPRPVPK